MQRDRGRMRVALIGAGRFGMKRASAVVKSASSTLTVVADAKDDIAEAAGRKLNCQATTDWRKAVAGENVDAVIVATPTHLSSEVGLFAVRAGKHVLTEKPCAATSEEFASVVDAAEECGVLLRAGYNLRYHRAIQRAHELFEEGIIGRPLFARCIYGHGGRIGYESEWRSKNSSLGGGELLDQGVHALDLFQWFLGDFQDVMGTLSTAFWPIEPAEDNVFALLRAPRNVVAQLHASWTNWKNIFSFEIFGVLGYLIVAGLGGTYGSERLCCGLRKKPGDVPEEQWMEFPDPDDSLQREWEKFVEAATNKHEASSNGRDALRTLLLVEAIRRSAHERCAVRL